MQYRKLTDLKKLEGNPRVIRDKQFKNLVASIKDNPKYFEARPLILSNRTGELVIIAGNQRYEAAKANKLKEAPTFLMQDLTEEKEREITIRDNTQQGEWDFDALANSWTALPLADWGVPLPEDWLTPPAGEPADAPAQLDKAEELNKIWKCETGQLWAIGQHRLLAGDSTKAEDVGRVMGGEKAVVFSDPPYGVDIVVGGGIGAANTYKKIIGDETTATAQNFYKVCLEVGMHDFVLWGGNYFTAFLPASPCWLIWDKREGILSNNFADCEIAWTSFDKPSRIYRHLWDGLLRKGNRKDELTGRVHPTQKPVGLAVNIMNDFPADIYFDGFLGSGSFMVAAQNVGKRMYGIEMDASYAATVLQRMTDTFPGIEIKRIES